MFFTSEEDAHDLIWSLIPLQLLDFLLQFTLTFLLDVGIGSAVDLLPGVVEIENTLGDFFKGSVNLTLQFPRRHRDRSCPAPRAWDGCVLNYAAAATQKTLSARLKKLAALVGW